MRPAVAGLHGVIRSGAAISPKWQMKIISAPDGIWCPDGERPMTFRLDPENLEVLEPGRVLYGTDFPQVPYAWDREVKQVCSLRLSDEVEAAVLGRNALALYAP